MGFHNNSGCKNVLGFFIAATFFLFSGQALAQSITLSGPSGAVVDDAEEYFTDQWGQGKDFNDTCDIGFDGWFFEPESSSGGVWTGVHPQVANPIVGVIPIPTLGSQLAFRENCGRLGVHYPLDANKYTFFSMRNATTNPTDFAVLWSYANDLAIFGIQTVDGYELHNAGRSYFNEPNTLSIKTIDLPAQAPVSHPWRGEVQGMSIFTTFVQPAGGSHQYDWIRIIDPDTSPTINLSWNSTGESATSFRDNVLLYVDTNNSGYDGNAVETGLAVDGSVDFMTGMLPPGTYYFYAQLETSSGGVPSVLARSNYIGPITINGKPGIKFNSPSRMGGAEYSETERGDAWDFSELTDVVNLFNPDGTPTAPFQRGFHDFGIVNGTFQAKTDFDEFMGVVDTQVHFTVPADRQVNPLNYRYFCYSMQVDPVELVRNGDAVELNRAGWVARLVWQDNATGDFGSSKAHELIERSQVFPDYDKGFVDFCVDLWDLESHESGKRWTDMNQVSVVRFDPLEAADVTTFAIDWAGLYAENITNNARIYEIEFELDDPEGDRMDVEFFYDSNRTGFNGRSIGRVTNLRNGSATYEWDASSVRDGTYYIYAAVNDGSNTTYFYADTTVRVGGISLPPVSDCDDCDTDGDGVLDGQEAIDFSDPFDDSSFKFELDTEFCFDWNGFIGLQLNIAEFTNFTSSTRNVRATLFDSLGSARGSRDFQIRAGAQTDLTVHDMEGFSIDSTGTVCAEILDSDAEPGDIDGRILQYRPDGAGNFDFVIAMPFSNPLDGSQFVQFNTFHPSLDANEIGFFAANWLTVASTESTAQTGTVFVYGQDGSILLDEDVRLGANGRVDIPVHQFGANLIGLLEWRPDNGSAGFRVTLNRYIYDGPNPVFPVKEAVSLAGFRGTMQRVITPMDTRGLTAILEISNTDSVPATINVKANAKTGQSVLDQNITLPGFATQHFILDGALASDLGLARVEGAAGARILVNGMQYGRTPTAGVSNIYPLPARQAIGTVMQGSYNTFLGQECSLLLGNLAPAAEVVSYDVTRFDGTVLARGTTGSIPGEGVLEVDLCNQDTDNVYGVVRVNSTSTNAVVGNVVRQGVGDNYRVATPVR